MDPEREPAVQADRRSKDRRLRVLVADDHPDTVETLATLLEMEGHFVQRAHNGAEVLPAVRTLRPDAVILDISVPGISGYAAAQAIRYTFTDVRRPLLIAMSGVWKEPPDRMVARNVGFDHYLVKPCDPRELLTLLAGLRNA